MESEYSTKNILFKYIHVNIGTYSTVIRFADSYIEYDDTMHIYDIANKQLMEENYHSY